MMLLKLYVKSWVKRRYRFSFAVVESQQLVARPNNGDVVDHQRSIQCRQLKVLLVLSAIGTFVQLAISTQVGKVDFAAHHQDGGK